MKNPLIGLTEEFAERVEAMMSVIRGEGMTVKPFFGLRSPTEQAKLWRQSRTWDEIERKLDDLTRAGAKRLAACIGTAGPQHGPRVTNAIPGLSWHQYGEAVDCFVVDEFGGAVWDANHKGYTVYAKAAKLVGLKAGRDFGDPVHVQLNQKEPYQVHTLAEIEDMLAERWPDFASLR